MCAFTPTTHCRQGSEPQDLLPFGGVSEPLPGTGVTPGEHRGGCRAPGSGGWGIALSVTTGVRKARSHQFPRLSRFLIYY